MLFQVYLLASDMEVCVIRIRNFIAFTLLVTGTLFTVCLQRTASIEFISEEVDPVRSL